VVNGTAGPLAIAGGVDAAGEVGADEPHRPLHAASVNMPLTTRSAEARMKCGVSYFLSVISYFSTTSLSPLIPTVIATSCRSASVTGMVSDSSPAFTTTL
jgi:hypothetical protein